MTTPLELTWHLIPDGINTIVRIQLVGEFIVPSATAVPDAEDAVAKFASLVSGRNLSEIKAEMERGRWLDNRWRPEERTAPRRNGWGQAVARFAEQTEEDSAAAAELGPEMTDVEVVTHLRSWVEQDRVRVHDGFAWPTDACGYDQHVRFVHHRNVSWRGSNDREDWRQFILAYATALEDGIERRAADPLGPCPCGGGHAPDAHDAAMEAGAWSPPRRRDGDDAG